MVSCSTALPGARKFPAGLCDLFSASARIAGGALEARALEGGEDALGIHVLWNVPADPVIAKHACIGIERRLPIGRLIDLDVYRADGRAIHRTELGHPPRPCLVCDRPAWDCIRADRHPDGLLSASTAAVLLGGALVEGARDEVDLTPKPGLVDLRDSGSHPDLSAQSMHRSIDLLPLYYEDLIALCRAGSPFPACIDAGRAAEVRMIDAIGTNAHRGYIFLSGLLLLAAWDCPDDGWTREPGLLSERIAARATAFFRAAGQRQDLPGSVVRRDAGLGGVRQAAESGLSAVLADALPALRRVGGRSGSLLAMARLMQTVEDTTAVRRCGLAGLARIREDGAELERTILAGEDPDGTLIRWNDSYRRAGLTMGGVADCLALTLALDRLTRDPAA